MELLFEIRISYSEILYQMKFIEMISLSNLIDIPHFAETKDT